ncbi:MAG: Ig-like domain-containing protein, partial [Verrucomicrobiota bacterium]
FQSFFRAAGGNTIASIGLDPDYNLAVAPASATNSGQSGKFVVSITNATSGQPVTYQVSGSASNGLHYTTLSGTTNVPSSGIIEIPVQPLYAAGALPDATVILTLVLGNGYLVNPSSASATMKIYPPRPAGMAVAIHDSGWTKTNKLSSTNWNYFVMPESVKEALRSDGTPYVVLSDLDIANGVLTNANGSPKYPILISLAAEAIRDEEIAPLANYVSNGGFVLAGSSSFTRGTNGGFRSDFALASQMGLSCSLNDSPPSAANWYTNTWLLKLTNHMLVDHLPDNVSLVWRMPTYADEINWGTCANGRTNYGPHPIWEVSATTATTLARGDYACPNPSCPYITVNPCGSGWFIYDAAMQPLVCHGGNGPGMYSYLIFRRAIEWAFQSAQQPVVRLSPWPYRYDAAYMVRHDLENYVGEIANVWQSAQYETNYGAKGDYYFCTGAITNEGNGYSFSDIVAGLQQAVSYGATIGSHNGGLPNPFISSDPNSWCYELPTYYQYFHWGPDEPLDLPGGYDYASNSVAISFAQIDAWLTNYQTPDPRTWVVPYFNGTREDSYQIQQQLNVKITGEQKLCPFPSWTLSTRTDGLRYPFLSEPVSDWFVAGDDVAEVAQVVGPWQGHDSGAGVHTSQTLQEAVNAYYTNGFLLNFYAHSLTYVTDGDQGGATGLMAEYVTNCAAFPRIWPANARTIYQWWTNRSTAQVTANSYPTNGGHSVVAVSITGAQDTNTAVDILASGFGSAAVAQLWTNGETNNTYRTSGELIKVLVGTTVTNVQVDYLPGPFARDDSYTATQGQALTVSAADGVLSNDFSGTWAGLVALTNSSPAHGTLAWDPNNDGGFTYTPNNGFWGTDCFAYEATDGENNFGTATVTVSVAATNGQTTALFSDDFNRCTGTALSPWQVYQGAGVQGQWGLGSGVMQGSSSLGTYGYSYLTNSWTDYSVQADIQFPAGAFGGGLGGYLNPATGAHYAAWVYPEGSAGGSNILAIIKFSTWTAWGNDPTATNSRFLAQASLASVGTTNHTLKLTLSGNNISVYYDDLATPKVSTSDTAYSSGGVCLDMWTYTNSYTMSVEKLIVPSP